MRLHNKLWATDVRIEFLDGQKGVVPATISKQDLQVFDSKTFVNRRKINFRILKEDLMEKSLPIRHFKYVTFDFSKYEVQGFYLSSTLKDVLILECEAIG